MRSLRRSMPLASSCALVVALTLGASVGCGDDDAPPAENDAGVQCLADPRADSYVANMEKMGSDGSYVFRLISSDPAPPTKGTNQWLLELTDATTGTPVEGAVIDVMPYMPDHGHGTSIVAQVTDAGGGQYTIAPVYLFMGGLWQVTITASVAGADDAAVFAFCIQS